MVFSSVFFLCIFLPSLLALYYIVPARLRNLVVLGGSLLFYAWGAPQFVFILVATSLVDFVCSRQMAGWHGSLRGRLVLALAITVNLGIFLYAKYMNFFVDQVNSVLHLAQQESIPWTAVVMPIGISFFTFQKLSYLIDVYRKTSEPAPSFGHYLLYVSLFPQLIAGPIVRYHDVSKQLVKRSYTDEQFLVEVAEDSSPASLTAWLDGRLAVRINDRVSRTIGFRPTCVRTVNQFKLALSGTPLDATPVAGTPLDATPLAGVPPEAARPDGIMPDETRSEETTPDRRPPAKPLLARTLNGIVIGKQDWLYGINYVQNFAAPCTSTDPSKTRELVSRVKLLQDMLEERGKAFVLVISPNKAELYPEFLPDTALEQRRQFRGRRFLDECRAEFSKQGVHYVDAPRILRECKNKQGPLLFSRTGLHWNYLACFLVWQEVLRTVNQHSALDIPIPKLAAVEYDEPRGTDNDLGRLLNLPSIPGGMPRVPYPVVDVAPLPFEQRPDFLFSGTSFTYALVDTAYFAKSARCADMLYYCQRLLRCAETDPTLQGGQQVKKSVVGAVASSDLDLEQALLDKEVVVLEFLEIYNMTFDFAFCQTALAVLKQADDDDTPAGPIDRTATKRDTSVR